MVTLLYDNQAMIQGCHSKTQRVESIGQERSNSHIRQQESESQVSFILRPSNIFFVFFFFFFPKKDLGNSSTTGEVICYWSSQTAALLRRGSIPSNYFTIPIAGSIAKYGISFLRQDELRLHEPHSDASKALRPFALFYKFYAQYLHV